MIVLQKLSGKEVMINSDLIECIEASPDTVITLVTGNRYVVKQSPEEVVQRVLEFKKKIFSERGHVAPDWIGMKKV